MKYYLSLILFCGYFSAFSQKAEVIHYPDLEKYFSKKDDTLYVINFWATWCKPCVEELPAFEKLNASYKEKKVKVVLISMDFMKNLETQLNPFIVKKKIQSSVFLLNEPNYNSWIDKVSPDWSGAIPATIFVNSSKNIRLFYEDSFEYSTLENKVKELLNP